MANQTRQALSHILKICFVFVWYENLHNKKIIFISPYFILYSVDNCKTFLSLPPPMAFITAILVLVIMIIIRERNAVN